MKEIWKDIKGYEGYYQVSNLGNVKRLKSTDKRNHTYKERMLTLSDKDTTVKSAYGDSYKRVHLSCDGIAKWYLVHRLVAEAFVPNPQNLKIVNHIDGSRGNNKADNLEWTTYKGNMEHASRIGRMQGTATRENQKLAVEVLKKPVIATDKDGNEFYFESQAEAAKQLNLSESVRGKIGSCCQEKYGYKTAGGYAWRYA